MATIEALHKELNYEAYKSELEANPAVFRTLKGAQTKAKRDPSSLPRYRQLLSQSIAVLEQANAAEPDRIVKDAKAFWAFYDEQVGVLNIADRESRRLPHPHQEWIEKFMPKTWAKFERAVAQTSENGSVRSYEALRQVSVEMLKAYIEGRE